MRVLMFGWEFPPHISGGLGTACFGMTQALARRGAEIIFVLPRIDSSKGRGIRVCVRHPELPSLKTWYRRACTGRNRKSGAMAYAVCRWTVRSCPISPRRTTSARWASQRPHLRGRTVLPDTAPDGGRRVPSIQILYLYAVRRIRPQPYGRGAALQPPFRSPGRAGRLRRHPSPMPTVLTHPVMLNKNLTGKPCRPTIHVNERPAAEPISTSRWRALSGLHTRRCCVSQYVASPRPRANAIYT